MQDTYESTYNPRVLEDFLNKEIAFQVAASFDANVVCTMAHKPMASSR